MTPANPPDPRQTVAEVPESMADAPADVATTDGQPGQPGATVAYSGQPAAPAPQPLPAVPGYEILGVLGRGGMGVVYKAQHLALKRTVALKMILAGGHAGADERERFRAEAEAVARLQHPSIVQVHEVGEHDGLPYAALEFVEGGTLAQRLAEQSLSPMDAARLVETLAAAVQLAHSRNIIHRDLKPANILLTNAGVPKITDFGLARQLDANSSQTRTGAVMGTPSYMSPEQASGVKNVGPATDIYALGAILYECLTSRPPFKGQSIVETLDLVRSQEPTPPHFLRAKTPSDLETICLKCLRKEPEKRYASAEALADDLRRWQAGEPIQARPVGRVERSVKWVKRNPVVTAALATGFVAALTLAILGVSLYYGAELRESHEHLQIAYKEAGKQRDLADERREEADAQRQLVVDREEEVKQQRDIAEQRRQEADKLRGVAEARGKEAIEQRRLAQRLKYASDMNQAMQAFHESQLSRMRELLDTYAPAHKELHEFTGFEWHYLDRLFHHHSLPLAKGKFAGPLTQANAPFLSGGVLPILYSWDAATQTPMQVPVTVPGLKPGINALQAHDASAGRLVIHMNDAWEVWDWRQVPPVRRLRVPKTNPSQHALMSADGAIVTISAVSGFQSIWDVENEKELCRIRGHDISAMSADGRTLAIFLRDPEGSEIKVLNPRTGETRVKLTHTEPLPYLRCLAFDPTGKRLAAACPYGAVRLWDVDSGQPRQTLRGGDHDFDTVAWSPDGKLVAAAGRDLRVRVWEHASGALVREFKGHDAWIRHIAFSPDGRHLVSFSSFGKSMILWDLDRAEQGSYRLAHTPVGAGHAVFDGKSQRLLWAGRRQQAIVSWSLESGTIVEQKILNSPGDISHPRPAALDPALQYHAICLNKPELLIQKIGSTDPHQKVALPAPASRIDYSPDSKRLALVLSLGPTKWALLVRDLATGQEWQHPLNSGGLVSAFSSDGRRVAIPWWDGKGLIIKFLDAATGQEEANTVLGPAMGGGVQVLAFGDNDRQLAASIFPGKIYIVDVESRKQIAAFQAEQQPVWTLAYSLDGRRLASASASGVRLWDPATGVQILKLPGYFDFLTFSPDGRMLAATAYQQTMVQIWDARPASAAPLLTPVDRTESTKKVDLDPKVNPPTVKKPPPDLSAMNAEIEKLAKGLKLVEVIADKGPFHVGDRVKITYKIANVANEDLELKSITQFGSRHHYVQRLGANPMIGLAPPNKNDKYDQGTIGFVYAASSPKIAKGKEFYFTQFVQTKGFPPGRYRYDVEFRGGKTPQTKSVEFELLAEKKSP